MNEETQTLEPKEPITATPAEVFGDDLPEEETTETQETTETTPETKPTPALTADQIRDSVREGVRSAQPPAAQAPAKTYTQDELDTLFNVWKPSEDFVQRILAGGEDGLKALVEMREGLSKQFATLLKYELEIAKNELNGKMEPALTFTQQQAASRDREEFFKQHEDLKDHEALVQTVFNALTAEGFQAKDVTEAYTVLADRTRKLLPTASNGSGATQSGGARTTTKTQPGKRPAALSSGSQAGGGGGDSAPVAPFAGGEVFL